MVSPKQNEHPGPGFSCKCCKCNPWWPNTWPFYQITAEEYNKWMKGGIIQISAITNGICSYSASETIELDPNSCSFHWIKTSNSPCFPVDIPDYATYNNASISISVAKVGSGSSTEYQMYVNGAIVCLASEYCASVASAIGAKICQDGFINILGQDIGYCSSENQSASWTFSFVPNQT